MASPVTQTAVEHYVSAFTDFQIDHPAPAWLSEKRRAAMDAFKHLGFPTTRDEEWKYTDVTPVANLAATPIFRPRFERQRAENCRQIAVWRIGRSSFNLCQRTFRARTFQHQRPACGRHH